MAHIDNRHNYFKHAQNDVKNLHGRIMGWANSSQTAESLMHEFNKELISAGHTVEMPNSAVIRYMARRFGIDAKRTVFGVKNFGEDKASRSRKNRHK